MNPTIFKSALAALLLAPVAIQAQSPYPATPAKPVTDVYHGTAVVDPYRWMEDMKSPEFQAWLKTQAAYADSVLAQLPGRADLRARLGVLADAGESTGGYEVVAGKLFYSKRAPGQNQARLWVRDGLAGAERELLDPNNLPGEPGKHAVDWYSVSPDGRLLAVGLSKGGSENSVLRLLDVATAKLLPLAIDRTGLNEGGVAWLPDASGFLYNRHPAEERYNKSAVFLHKLGQDPAKDVAQFGWGVEPPAQALLGRPPEGAKPSLGRPGERLASKKEAFEIADLPYIRIAKGSPWALAEVLHGDAAERSYWVARVDQLKGAATPWRRVVRPEHKVTRAEVAGGLLFALSQQKASRRELLSLDLASAKAGFKTALPAGDSVLQSIDAGDAAVYVKALDAGVSKLWRVGKKDGKVSTVALPFEGTLRSVTPLKGDELLVLLEGWTQTPQSLLLQAGGVADAPAQRLTIQKPVSVDTSGLEARRVMVKSHDGVMVPLSIVAPKAVALDGQRPTILNAYGAYGITQEPRFSATRLAWIERGGVQAICHVRGGGELGDDWHRGGYIATKQNTVSDFVACAEWLIANKYTSPAKLAGTGGSAGGITIGGAVTQRGELFAAAQSAVGLSDMLRMELTLNGAPNIAEFGTVTNPAHFKSMFALSPYHNVKDGRSYPAVIVTTGANDPRVEAWIPAKLAARMQTANPDAAKTRPVILRVDFEGGHGMGSGLAQRLDETADVWSFFLWQFGDAAFQPKR
ncbi:prolyl oligopeptidase family serine peptidase [Roseateles sp.]|uniref:prolyl oligopeptidase family serine peptidase n=1 Tax=Roseateles sp. TaxID=1971397 RepID=UPI00286CCA80|nr:prolyl oligopeptidase family serine peptidase [Roseateles sp.]